MPSQVLDLSNLTAQQGFIIQGDAAGDNAGYSVASAGDINGDGIEDIIVGANRGDDGGEDAGEVYVIYGSNLPERDRIDLNNLAPADGFIIQGNAAGDFVGNSVSSAGDVNGDGIDDIIVGARGGDDGGNGAGEAYVIYGTTGETRDTVDLDNLSRGEGFIIQGGADGDSAGRSVSSGGDVNGDGIDDIIIGASLADKADGGLDAGAAYVVYGTTGTDRGNLDLGNLQPTDGFIIQGDQGGDRAGYSVSSAGDVNGDGIDDIIVTSPFHEYSRGETYIIYGSSDTDRERIDLTDLTPEDGFGIRGVGTYDLAGRSVSSAGDVNGDGIDDIIIGAPYADHNDLLSRGEVYVIYGVAGTEREDFVFSTSPGAARFLEPEDGFVIRGGAANDRVGFSVASAGDVDGDGIDDIIVGASGGSDGGRFAGETYVIYGTTGTERGTLVLNNLAPEDGFIVRGDAEGDVSGSAVSSAGDVNGDGIDDIIVGARRGDDGGDAAGEAYVIYGAVTTEGQVVVGDGDAEDLIGGDGSDAIVGIAGNDDLVGGLGGDLIIGGFDSDLLDGGIGDDIIIGDNNELIAGADELIGGVGDDLLEGGGGADTFVFRPNEGHDTIGKIAVDYDNPHNSTVIGADFVNGVDRVDLTEFNFADEEEVMGALTDVNGVATFSSHGTTITFVGLTVDDFTANDFLFGDA